MKEFIHFGLVLLIIAAISAGILNFVNNKTTPIINERNSSAQIDARKAVYSEANSFKENEKIDAEGYFFIPAYKDTEQIGYVVSGIGQGYGGEINLTMAFDLSGKIKGVKILSAKETPGLGDKIFNEDWLKRWVDRDKNYEFKVGIDSFAGATISPKAVHSELIKILKVYDEKVKK